MLTSNVLNVALAEYDELRDVRKISLIAIVSGKT